MARFEHSAVLHAPPERVFALLERVEDFADYSDMISAVERLDHYRYRWHINALRMDWSFIIEITEHNSPNVLAWESLEGVRNQGRYELTEMSEGTLVELIVDYQIGNRLLEKTVNRAAGPLARRASQQIIECLKARL
ncbi:type II toxin-antitoxin system RatA family toxin [Phytohalomonas tamaricis]|uniref:type II toxin-antitoxin system RatA family toxin n=1 Tax=Phytohalomonas tamaricis TaxID=2081032 RepID=UPI000D0AC142|nr:SRPBCC family protein [Phytohalomonas tamaricis]